MKKFFLLIFTLSLTQCQNLNVSNFSFVDFFLWKVRSERIIIEGNAVKGILRRANVSIFALESDGTCSSTVLAQTQSNESGYYTLAFNKPNASAVCVKVSPSPLGVTDLYDEKTKSFLSVPTSSDFHLTSIYPLNKIRNNRKFFSITPLSRILANRLTQVQKTNPGSDVTALHTQESIALVNRFGLNKGIIAKKQLKNIEESNLELEDIAISSSSLSNPQTLKLVVVLTGFSQLGNGNLDNLEKVVSTFESDYADGVFDGKDVHGNTLAIPLGNGSYQTLTSDSLNDVFLPSIVQFFESGGSVNIGLGNTEISLNPTELQSTITFSSGGNNNSNSNPPSSNQPTVQFANSSSSGLETVNNISIPVVLSAASSSTVTINYTVSGTATSGADHNLSNGTLTFNPGETTKYITFTVTNDLSAEPNETIIITLGSPINATLGANTTHTYT
ncbi:MAG: hypothetical protein N3A69_11020, partial [Leptospiraceae bacterium]|nr:hypothetical protein [Leptospiraceae bacterium]